MTPLILNYCAMLYPLSDLKGRPKSAPIASSIFIRSLGVTLPQS